MKFLFFNKIKFLNISYQKLKIIFKNNGLYVFPSGPGLSSINKDKAYHHALINSDYVFFDSGFFVILLRILKNIKVKKLSGYLFVKFLLSYLKKNNSKSIFLIDPNKNYSFNNQKLILKQGLLKKNINFYIAPIYNSSNIKDKTLLKKINFYKPEIILINIGGGTQEILGLFLKNNIKYSAKIICTGAAISFFTGDQAPINNLIDRLYLGWLIRLIFNPLTFLKRYFFSIRLIPLTLFSKVEIKND